MTARSTPAQWTVGLRDLSSRLRALATIGLAEPDDALLKALIVKLSTDRQLLLDEATVSYLAEQIERSCAAASGAVARLDEASLRLHRPVTRALAAEIIGTSAP
jgi:chromosomal replication initiation ATPase DnaA